MSLFQVFVIISFFFCLILPVILVYIVFFVFVVFLFSFFNYSMVSIKKFMVVHQLHMNIAQTWLV